MYNDVCFSWYMYALLCVLAVWIVCQDVVYVGEEERAVQAWSIVCYIALAVVGMLPSF